MEKAKNDCVFVLKVETAKDCCCVHYYKIFWLVVRMYVQ
jgi:hypothetical protein